MPRNQLSPIVCAMAVSPMGRVGEGQGDLVQGLRGEDGGGAGERLGAGGDRPCGMFSSTQAGPERLPPRDFAL